MYTTHHQSGGKIKNNFKEIAKFYWDRVNWYPNISITWILDEDNILVTMTDHNL